jgi:hypothetical protein
MYTLKNISKKISRKLKKYFKTHSTWNKGKKFVSETWATRHRRDRKYYLEELQKNAIRRTKRGYDKKRMDEIERNHKRLLESCGHHGWKRWTGNEEIYLRINYKELYIAEMAKELKRSYVSVMHKLIRMGLLYNHKWIIKKRKG